MRGREGGEREREREGGGGGGGDREGERKAEGTEEEIMKPYHQETNTSMIIRMLTRNLLFPTSPPQTSPAIS